MPPRNSNYPEDWLRIARKDWARVEMLLKEDDPALAGFCLQQAVEKFLKAFLLSRGWRLRRIHNLDALLEDALQYNASLETYRAVCQRITAFYIVERYPFGMENEVTKNDVTEALNQVKDLVELIQEES